MIVSPTHKQGEAVTNELRSRLKQDGLIGKKEIKASKLSNLNFTDAQKSDWRNFEKGQEVQFNQNVPQIKRGRIFTIKDVSEKGTVLISKKGDEHLLPHSRSSAFNIFRQSELSLSRGDKVKITLNSFDLNKKRLDNGTLLEVASVKKSGVIKLVNKASQAEFSLNTDFGHIDHAYCTTSHSAQGKTVDEVFISQPSSTFAATDAKQFYVSISRGRDSAKIFTDDRIALLEHALQIGDRQSALELVANTPTHSDYVIHEQKETLQNRFAEKIESDREVKTIDYEPGF